MYVIQKNCIVLVADGHIAGTRTAAADIGRGYWPRPWAAAFGRGPRPRPEAAAAAAATAAAATVATAPTPAITH